MARGVKELLEFFTILFLDYELKPEGAPPLAHIIYATEAHCQQALNWGLADPVYDHLMSLYGNDIMMWCHVTDHVSKPVTRPRSRPKDVQ